MLHRLSVCRVSLAVDHVYWSLTCIAYEIVRIAVILTIFDVIVLYRPSLNVLRRQFDVSYHIYPTTTTDKTGSLIWAYCFACFSFYMLLRG
jgi:hypothetical protein